MPTFPELLMPFHKEKYTIMKTVMRQSAIDHLTFPRSPKPVDLLISNTARL